MKFIIDSREQHPYTFQHYSDVSTEIKALNVGDYSIPGFEDKFAIERKSINDLVSCLMGKNRKRFERELSKAQHYALFIIVVEADTSDVLNGKYQSKMNPHSVWQSIAAFQVRYGIPFHFCGNRETAEYVTFSFLSKFAYEIEQRFKTLNKYQSSRVSP